MNNEKLEFDCPSCGNPLYESTKPVVKCPYCGTIIVPRCKCLNRREHIYERKENAKANH